MDKAKKAKQGIIASVAIGLIIIVAVVLANNPPTSMTNAENSSSNQVNTSEESSKSNGRISKAAYDKIKTGMLYDDVRKIIGSEGQSVFESGDKGTDSYQISYMWFGENGGEATISFSGKDKLAVLMKSQSELK